MGWISKHWSQILLAPLLCFQTYAMGLKAWSHVVDSGLRSGLLTNANGPKHARYVVLWEPRRAC